MLLYSFTKVYTYNSISTILPFYGGTKIVKFAIVALVYITVLTYVLNTSIPSSAVRCFARVVYDLFIIAEQIAILLSCNKYYFVNCQSLLNEVIIRFPTPLNVWTYKRVFAPCPFGQVKNKPFY